MYLFSCCTLISLCFYWVDAYFDSVLVVRPKIASARLASSLERAHSQALATAIALISNLRLVKPVLMYCIGRVHTWDIIMGFNFVHFSSRNPPFGLLTGPGQHSLRLYKEAHGTPLLAS